MEVGIKEIAYNSLSFLVVSGIISEEEFNESTKDKRGGYDDLYDLIEEKNGQLYLKAQNDSQS